MHSVKEPKRHHSHYVYQSNRALLPPRRKLYSAARKQHSDPYLPFSCCHEDMEAFSSSSSADIVCIRDANRSHKSPPPDGAITATATTTKLPFVCRCFVIARLLHRLRTMGLVRRRSECIMISSSRPLALPGVTFKWGVLSLYSTSEGVAEHANKNCVRHHRHSSLFCASVRFVPSSRYSSCPGHVSICRYWHKGEMAPMQVRKVGTHYVRLYVRTPKGKEEEGWADWAAPPPSLFDWTCPMSEGSEHSERPALFRPGQ